MVDKINNAPPDILVVDDEQHFLDSVSRILQTQHYQVQTALGGAKALEILHNTPFDVVLLDLMMPEVSGPRVLDYVIKNRPDTAVIIVSATDSVQEATDALLQGAQDFLRKPYEVNNLLICVKRALWNRELKRENRRVQAQIRESEHQHRFVVNNSPDLVFILDENGRFVFSNEQFEALLGFAVEDLSGLPFSTIVNGADQEKAGDALAEILEKDAKEQTVELNLACLDTNRRAQSGSDHVLFEIKMSAGAGEYQPSKNSIYGAGRDLTARKVAEQRIRKLAYYDPLTGLPNRQLFSDRIRQALQRAQRAEQSMALLFLDLDQFKYINDTLGHSAGDQVLKEAADRLTALIRKEDSIARMGGDEFTIIIEQIKTAADAGQVARKVNRVLNRPFEINRHKLHVGTSIGISLFPQDGKDEETLVKNADVAMYRAKLEGRNNYQFYTPKLTEWMLNRLGLEHRLRDAIKQQRLVLFYQPQFDLHSNRLVGVEALVRWLDPKEGLLMPDRFLPLAEESGLILPLGNWVLNQACLQAKAWKDEGLPFGRVAVNLSTKQLLGHDIVQSVKDVLDHNELDPGVLELEITESVFLEPRKTAIDILVALRNLGITLSIDDFGTGFSSLHMLKHLPIDKLKIDRSFVLDIPSDRNGEAIVQAILAMGESLKMGVIAEGVEREAQRHFLQTAGCKTAQGFLYSRPLSQFDMSRMLSNGGFRDEAHQQSYSRLH